ncbi:MAG: sugar phosphate isomerase/epimerase [Gemmataceae bacterium]|nr:sugar phosphate isomerase/epimerase [Gemmataceae bacterium]
MFTLSAFADEIDPDPVKQLDVLEACGVKYIELRSIHQTNVLALSDEQVAEFETLIRRRGFGISAIGSPIGKVPIDEPFGPHLLKFDRAIDLARRLGTPNIRVFSFYPAAGEDERNWPGRRAEVIRRMRMLAERVANAGVRLVHENEHRIYGDSPGRVADLLTSVDRPALVAAYDPANFVFCGYDPWEGWLKCRDRVCHLHIKDWVHGEAHGRVAGAGQGRIRDVLTDAVRRGYDGFAVLEPHLLGGGPTGGVTGPELFPRAVETLRQVICEAGGTERMP